MTSRFFIIRIFISLLAIEANAESHFEVLHPLFESVKSGESLSEEISQANAETIAIDLLQRFKKLGYGHRTFSIYDALAFLAFKDDLKKSYSAPELFRDRESELFLIRILIALNPPDNQWKRRNFSAGDLFDAQTLQTMLLETVDLDTFDTVFFANTVMQLQRFDLVSALKSVFSNKIAALMLGDGQLLNNGKIDCLESNQEKLISAMTEFYKKLRF